MNEHSSVKPKMIDAHMHISQWMREDGRSAFEALRDYQEQNGIALVDNMCCSNVEGLWENCEPNR